MNWATIGTVADVVSAIGVIVSLLYVGVQIRQSNNLSQANTSHQLSSKYGSNIGALASDERLAAIYAKTLNAESRDEIELVRFRVFLTRYFAFLENAYTQEKPGLFDVELEADTVVNFMAAQAAEMVRTQQLQDWWKNDAPRFLAPEFHLIASKWMALGEPHK